MQQEIVDKIKNSPKYQELVSKRSRFGWILSAVVCLIYYGFILVIAFKKEVLGIPLSAGSVTTIGIPVGILVIVSAFAFTGLYVWRANGEFDEITRKIKEDLR